MDQEASSGLCEAIKTIAHNGNLDHEIKRARTIFDGSSADAFAKWMTEMDAIQRTLKDNSDTIWAAQQLFTGPALDSTRDLSGTHKTWNEFNAALSENFAHLNPTAHCKKKENHSPTKQRNHFDLQNSDQKLSLSGNPG